MPDSVVAQNVGMFTSAVSPAVTVGVPAGATSIQIAIQPLTASGVGRRPEGDFVIEKPDGTPLAWTKQDGRTGTGAVGYPYNGLYVVSPAGVASVRVRFEGTSPHEFRPISVSILVYAPSAAAAGGGVAVTDESVLLGVVPSLRFTGAGVTVTEEDGVAVVNVLGGGGGESSVLTFSQVFSGPGVLSLPGVLAGTPEVMNIRLYGTMARADGVTLVFDFSTPWYIRDDGLFMVNDQIGNGMPLIAPSGTSHRLRFVVNDGVLGVEFFQESNDWTGFGPNVWTLTINVIVLSRNPLADSGATMVPAIGSPETERVVTVTPAHVAHDPARDVRTLQKVFIANPDGGSWDFVAPFDRVTREIRFTPSDQGWDGRPAAVMVSVDGGDANRVFVGTLKGA